MTRNPGDILTAARDYLARGWRPIPVPRGEKAPTRSKWQHLRVTVEDLGQHFASGRENIGLLLGDPSGGPVGVDLDAAEAVAAATVFLPPTQRRHGRPGKPDSHWWYVADPIPRPETWKDTDQVMLCELRSTGQQNHRAILAGRPLRWAFLVLLARVETALLNRICASS